MIHLTLLDCFAMFYTRSHLYQRRELLRIFRFRAADGSELALGCIFADEENSVKRGNVLQVARGKVRKKREHSMNGSA